MSGNSVVIIDDREGERDFVAHVLRQAGYLPVSFASPLEARAAIRSSPPDLVFCDLMMAELDGFDIVRGLREEPTTRDQPVIVCSAIFTQQDVAELGLDGPRCVFVPKPVTPEQLLAAVSTVLDPGLPPSAPPSPDFEQLHRDLVRRKLVEEVRRTRSAELILGKRVHHDAALAELGREALSGISTAALNELGCQRMAQVLAADFVELLESEEPSPHLTMIAGHGWPAGVVGAAAAGTDYGSLAACTVAANGPLIFEDLTRDGRFAAPTQLVEHGVRSGIVVAVPHADGGKAILGIHSCRERAFTDADAAFVVAVAALLGSAATTQSARLTLEGRERVLRALFDGADDGLLVVGDDFRIVRANAAASALFGREIGELIGLRPADTLAPESLPAFAVVAAAYAAKRVHRGELTVLRPDGERRLVEHTASAELLPGLHLVSLRDVTDRHRMESELRVTMAALESKERRYVDLIEALPDGILSVDASGRIVLVNEQTERMFGYRRSELIGRRVELLIPGSLRGRRKDGSEFPIEVSVSAATIDDTKLVTSVVTDVTERKQLELRLQHAQKMEAVGGLAGGIAHDFNNLLQVISGYTASLADRLAGTPEADDLGQIAVAADRAAALTRQLLAFSRQQLIEPVTLDLNAVVRQLEQMLACVTGKNVALSIDLAPEPCAVVGDPNRLEQVLVNLAVNAGDAMPAGGRLTIATRNCKLGGEAVRLGLEPGPYVLLTVADTGSGMDDATVARVFEPFFTTKERGQGTGLGLALVHGIVEQCGGAVEIATAVGEGTTISVCLPRATFEAHTHTAEPAAAPIAGRGERILLVDDEGVVRGLYVAMLSELGYDVAAVESGLSALSAIAAAERAFDIVVTDVVMPGMSGGTLFERLHALGPVPPVLFISGYVGGPGVDVALAAGRTAFLQKPFMKDDLARSVRALLDEGTLSRQP